MSSSCRNLAKGEGLAPGHPGPGEARGEDGEALGEKQEARGEAGEVRGDGGGEPMARRRDGLPEMGEYRNR